MLEQEQRRGWERNSHTQSHFGPIALSVSVCIGPTGPEGLPSDPPAPTLEDVQEVQEDPIPEESPPVSISDDPDIAWDLMASGFLVLTGQWASWLKGKGSKKEKRLEWAAQSGGVDER